MFGDKFTNNKLKQDIFLFGSVCINIGLCFSPVLITVGVIFLAISALLKPYFFQITTSTTVQDTQPFQSSFWRMSNVFLWLLFFVYVLFSFVYTDTLKDWQDEVRRRLPFLIIPLSFFAISKSHRLVIQLAFIFSIMLVSIATLVHYLTHYDEINKLILMAQSVPVKWATQNLTHIYYGILAAFGALFCFQLFGGQQVKNKYVSFIVIMIGLFLVFCLHFFSNRTGLVTFYVGLLAAVVWLAYQKNKWQYVIYVGAFLCLALVSTYTFSQGFRNRVQSTKDDLALFTEKKNISYASVGKRIAVWVCAWHIIKEHPFVGVSPGNTNHVLLAQYEKETFIIDKPERLPDSHNQFIETTLGMGFLGLIIFLSALLLPLFYNKQGELLIFILACGVAFCFESVLERQIGITFFIYYFFFFCQE